MTNPSAADQLRSLLAASGAPFTLHEASGLPGAFRYLVSLSQIFRGITDPLAIVLLPQGRMFPADSNALRKFLVADLGLADRTLAIILYSGAGATSVPTSVRWVCEPTDQFLDAFRQSPYGFLRQAVLQRFSLGALNPYQSTRPVTEDMFFGRAHEVFDLCQSDDNYLIVGPRRGGKTSLAYEVCRRLRADGDFRLTLGKGLTENRYLYSVAYIDAERLVRPDALWDSILLGMGLEQRDLQGGVRKRLKLTARRTVTDKLDYELLLDLLRFKYKRCVLLIDESDSLIRFDEREGWPIFGKLRALADDRAAKTKVIVFGYEALSQASRNRHFPLHGRFQLRTIANLDRDGVADLIEQPLQGLDIRLDDLPQIVKMIDRATGGMPNLVQDVLKAVLSQPEVQRQRSLNPRFMAQLLDDERHNIIRSVYEAFNALDDTAARLVAYLAAAGTGEVRFFEILERLRTTLSVAISEKRLRSAFDCLCLHNVFHGSGGQGYSFASQLLEDRLKEDQAAPDANLLIRSLADDLKKEMGLHG